MVHFRLAVTIPGLGELTVKTIISEVGLDMNKWSTENRMAALSLGKGRSAIAGFYRRIKARSGAAKAVTATARKLACMFYRLLKYGTEYVEQGIELYEKQYEDTKIQNLIQQATRLGFEVVKSESMRETVS